MQFILPTACWGFLFRFFVPFAPAQLLRDSLSLAAQNADQSSLCKSMWSMWRQPDGATDIHSQTVITKESAEQQALEGLFHVPHVSLAILASTNHKDGPLSVHTAPSQIACWAAGTVVEFLLTPQFVQSAHCKHLFFFFFFLILSEEEAERGREQHWMLTGT